MVWLDVEEEWARRPFSEGVLTKVNVVINICMIRTLILEKPVASYTMLLSKLLQAGFADIHAEASAKDRYHLSHFELLSTYLSYNPRV